MGFLAEHGWVWFVGLAGFLCLWVVSLVRRDASVVDFWWGPGFGAMALTLWVSIGRPMDLHVLAILVPLVMWSLRLGVHLGARRIAEGEEDARYRELRAAWSPNWPLKSLFIVFLLQAVLQGIIASGVLAGIVAARGSAHGPLVLLIALAAVAAIAAQTVSDLQLDRYRRAVPHGGLLTTGLRGRVRYPSYSAEIAIWSLLSLNALLAGVWWAPLSALTVAALLRYVSGVTILDDRMSRTRGEMFPAYSAAVPALVPRFFSRSRSAQGGRADAAARRP